MNFEKICIFGMGYIGLPTASTFAGCGKQVLGVDINPNIIDTLARGEIHIHEPGLLELAKSVLKKGLFKVSQQPEKSDAFIIAVPTPFYNDKKADLRAVCSAAEAIVPFLEAGNLVVLESTSPPRTTSDVVRPILERSGLKAGRDFYLAYSPERVLPGQILRELVENDRVIGGISSECAEAGKALYSCIAKGEIVTTDATTAEMVKLMENTYRDVNIAIANEFSRLADRFGVDVWEAISIANRHPRVNILNPGPGVGGHCISVDPWFFVEAAPDLANLIRTARQVNDSQPTFVVDLIHRVLGDMQGKHIALLGLAYKPDVDDLRESPAVAIARLLVKEGAQVKAFEPFKPDFSILGVTMVSTLEEAICDAEVVVLLVGHNQFMNLIPSQFMKLTKARLMIDAVNGFSPINWLKEGISVIRLGDGKTNNGTLCL
jgi:UDP-N-acetyl-D-mannosaminuronic acid dehydrogenase